MKKLLFIISFWVYVISVSAQENDTITTDSGLKYYIVEEGYGEKVEDGKEVKFSIFLFKSLPSGL